MLRRSLVVLLVPAALPAWALGSDPPTYDVIYLGLLLERAPYPYAISSDGRVVVNVRDAQGLDHSAVWEDGVLTPLPLLPGTERSISRTISDTGLIAGSCGPFSDLVGTVWEDGQPRAIGTLGGTLSDIMHLSARGNIAGYSRPFLDQGLWHGFAVIDGVMHDLGPMPHYDVGGASVINDAGRVAGTWTNYKDQDVPFIWDLEHGIRELPTLGGVDCEITDINNAGQISGYAGDGLPLETATLMRQFPVRWESDGRITRLPTTTDLPNGEGNGINERGDVVGFVNNRATAASAAAIWIDSTLYLLEDLTPDATGWRLLKATDINAAGEIVGTGTRDGQSRSFLLRPR